MTKSLQYVSLVSIETLLRSLGYERDADIITQSCASVEGINIRLLRHQLLNFYPRSRERSRGVWMRSLIVSALCCFEFHFEEVQVYFPHTAWL